MRRGENHSTRRKTSRSRVENQQQTQPTYDAGSGNQTRDTLMGGERSHHCVIPAPRKSFDLSRHGSVFAVSNLEVICKFTVESLKCFFFNLCVIILRILTVKQGSIKSSAFPMCSFSLTPFITCNVIIKVDAVSKDGDGKKFFVN